MATQISITIRDGLHKRLQAVKAALNVSGVCQEAIEAAVRLEEIRNKGEETMDSTLERLREEKAGYAEQYRVRGREIGLVCAKKLSYGELVEVVNADVTTLFNRHDELFWKWCEDEISDCKQEDPAFDTYAFMEGWVESVHEFFESVEDQI